MKKRLAAAITTALVVGVASTTFAAANPFVDVPAKHWSYDAVTKLAQAGIVDGYGDGTYRGDRTITRYEMAQIVAKALTKADRADAEQKAALDKLAVEFAAELDNLGVRVAKLEANQSKIKLTGDVRLRFVDDKLNDKSAFAQRFRLNLNADVNENTSFYGRFVGLNHNETGSSTKDGAFVADAALTTKNLFNTGLTSTVGRFSQYLGSTGLLADTTGGVDGLKLSAGNTFKVTAGIADVSERAGFDADTWGTDEKEVVFAEAKYDLSKATSVTATYFAQTGSYDSFDIFGGGFKSKLSKNFAIAGDYYKNSSDVNDGQKAWIAQVNYKGAKAVNPQSWGLGVAYHKIETGAIPTGLTTSSVPLADSNDNGLKAWTLSADYTLSKNIVLQAFQTFDTKYTDGGDADDYTRAQINFLF
ncbi:putative porin|uniref:S-layer homology domain-containing protein n=1 Tax=Dendrosporobacter quercicolus TaxID=146817 RepID=A0A1G9WLD5_9FIRM|nr:putative porin [Dendrosporobacter quercicolus]NSL49147.1 putative porin [Dendrosporobacter quercicolus DSM 1736]SDM85412.1 S-layer homology domain-containing protein [Dendrosporobacter quercicolus]